MSITDKMISDYQDELIRLARLYENNGLTKEQILYGLIGVALVKLNLKNPDGAKSEDGKSLQHTTEQSKAQG